MYKHLRLQVTSKKEMIVLEKGQPMLVRSTTRFLRVFTIPVLDLPCSVHYSGSGTPYVALFGLADGFSNIGNCDMLAL